MTKFQLLKNDEQRA